MQCPHCGLYNPEGTEKCDCGFSFRTQTAPEFRQQSALPISILKVFAWLNLAGGLIEGVSILATPEISRPIRIGMGLTFIAAGVFGCGFLLVVALVSENVIEIRRMLTRMNDRDKSADTARV